MSYGKYGMKNIGTGMPNNMMGIAYNDPWFAAGALLAQNWNKNYEDRGNKKAIDAALAELSPTGNAQEQQMATQQFQRMQPQGDTLQGRNMLGIGAGYTVPTGKGLLGGEIPPAASNATATGTGVLSSIMPPEPESDEPSARELLSLQGMPQGTGLFGSIFPEKEEPKGGLFANVLGNYRLGGEGGTCCAKCCGSAGSGTRASAYPRWADYECADKLPPERRRIAAGEHEQPDYARLLGETTWATIRWARMRRGIRC